MSIMDVSLRRILNSRMSVTVTLPMVNNNFSMLYPPQGSPQGDRHSFSANGIGDVSIFEQNWLLSPKSHPFGNVAVGVGIKIPTGMWNVQRVLPNETGLGYERRAVYPPSIMPGDGGTGIIVGINGFKTIRTPPLLRGNTVFGSASYLCNPRGTNGTSSIVQSLGVPLAPNFQNQLTNSVTDSYNLQLGTSIKLPHTWDNPKLKTLRARLVYNWEGIPNRDLIGSSNGFRQAGYIMSCGPGFSYSHGKTMFILDVPITFNAYIDPNSTAIPGLPTKTSTGGLLPAAFSDRRNLGMVAPVALSMRCIRSF